MAKIEFKDAHSHAMHDVLVEGLQGTIAAQRTKIQQARDQAIDDAVKVVREELDQQAGLKDAMVLEASFEKHAFAARRLGVLVERMDKLR